MTNWCIGTDDIRTWHDLYTGLQNSWKCFVDTTIIYNCFINNIFVTMNTHVSYS